MRGGLRRGVTINDCEMRIQEGSVCECAVREKNEYKTAGREETGGMKEEYHEEILEREREQAMKMVGGSEENIL